MNIWHTLAIIGFSILGIDVLFFGALAYSEYVHQRRLRGAQQDTGEVRVGPWSASSADAEPARLMVQRAKSGL